MIQQDIKRVRDKNKNNYKRTPGKNRIYLCMIQMRMKIMSMKFKILMIHNIYLMLFQK